MDPARQIALLGGVSIGASDTSAGTVPLRGRRTELVFAYLAAEHHRLVTQDELADALWPQGLPDTWEAALRGVVTDVRRFCADGGFDPREVLTTARRGYRFHLPVGVTLDLDEARSALAAARAQLAAGAAGDAVASASRASKLARLSFLPNHDADWVDGIRRELDSLSVRALEVQARANEAAGDLGAAAAAALELVMAEPFNESAHQLRILLLGRAGDRSGAIKAFEHCREVLRSELGIEPSEETAAVLQTALEERTAPPSAPVPMQNAAAAANPLATLSMLVVEDHDFQRRTAVMLLRNLGVGAIAEASDGAEALRVLGGIDVPDVILCDIDMPGMDGVEFIRHVGERALAGAVIIASALDAKVRDAVRSVSESHGLQVLGAIEKPLTARRLGELVAAYQPRSRSAPAAGSAHPPVSAGEVTQALADGRITFHVQPAVDVATGAMVAVEVVTRWVGEDDRRVPPAAFLPILEREGQLAELSARALVAACDCRRAFTDAGIDVAVTLELARPEVQDGELADRAAATARTAGADPACITLGLDERAVRGAASVALRQLTRLRVKGFGVAIHGFGSTTGPREQLAGLPLTQVQLAQQLVSAAAGDAPREAALDLVIESGRELGVPIVADGCDGEADLRLLLSLGCDRVQGPLIAHAMPLAELLDWLPRWDPARLGVGGDAR